MSKPGTEYYNLEKVSEVLSISAAEVNRLREQNKLRGFRDGTTWKFNKAEIHAYLAESIKARNSEASAQIDDSDFSLAEEEDSDVSFDILDAALPDEDQLISASSASAKPDLDLAALDMDDELALAEETQVSVPAAPATPKTSESIQPLSLQEEPEEDLFEVDLEEDSSALVLDSAEDDDSVFGAAGSSPQLGLAGDSGFDVLIDGDDDAESDVLLVADEKTEIGAPGAAAEDFILEPALSASGDDDSESSSQVIAIDVGLMEEPHDADPFGSGAFDGFADFDTGIQEPAPAAVSAPSGPFGESAPAGLDFAVTPAPAKKPAVPEDEYSRGMLIALTSALVIMLLVGVFMLDTVIHMWSWNQPFPLSSYLMSTIAGLFGL